MKLYSRYSLYRFRTIRRLRYGRGRGVHSPRAFSLIHSLIRPYATYYDFRAHPALFRERMHGLIYRIVARCGVRSLVGNEIEPSLVKAATLASPVLIVADVCESAPAQRLFLTPKPIDLQQFTLSEGDMILLSKPVRNSELREWVKGLESVIILDLYEAILIVYMPNVKYLYRSTL